MEIYIDPSGIAACIYDEAIDLTAIGVVSIRRASHDEPDRQGRWWADMAPIGGPRLGPYSRRSEALASEKQYILSHLAGSFIRPDWTGN